MRFRKIVGPIGILANYYQKRQGDNGVVGGIMKRQNPQQSITNYIDVSSTDDYVDKVNKLGGKVVVLKMALPGTGYLVVCLDTENNTFRI